MKFLDDSAWFCMEKLKKHSLEKTKSNLTKHTKQIQKDTDKNPFTRASLRAHFDSLSLAWTHLDPLGFPWIHVGALGFQGIHLGLTSTHKENW